MKTLLLESLSTKLQAFQAATLNKGGCTAPSFPAPSIVTNGSEIFQALR